MTAKRLDSISKSTLKKNFVEDIKYDKDLVSLMNSNIRRLSLWILIISGIFTAIAVLLINSSIRLAVYSKRFSIKTMQMVGATKKFIRRPFIWRSIRLGIIGSLMAIMGMTIVLYYMDITFPELLLTQNKLSIGLLFASIFLTGVLITWWSTFFATQRFLNLKTDQLHY